MKAIYYIEINFGDKRIPRRQYFGGYKEGQARQRATSIAAYWRRLFDGKTAVWAEVHSLEPSVEGRKEG